MPKVTGPADLTLTTTNGNTTINVKYNVSFEPFERRLAKLGLVFRERIRVIGVDASDQTRLADFPARNLNVTDGSTQQVIPRDVKMTVPRDTLQEDAGLGDDDEIRCSIRIEALGLPPTFTESVLTDGEVLLG